MLAPEVAEPIDGVRDAVERAAAGDWTAIEPHVAQEVAVVRSPGTDAESLVLVDGGRAVAWLRERWQPGVAIRGEHLVEHHPFVDFCTGPWVAVPPSGDVIHLRAHLQRVSDGPARWLIDVVLYE